METETRRVLQASVPDTFLLTLSCSWFYKRPCKCLPHLDRARIDFSTLLFSPCASIHFCSLLVWRKNQGWDKMLSSLYKSTCRIPLIDIEEECPKGDETKLITVHDHLEKSQQQQRREENEMRCSDRRRKGSSIKRMMMQAHVKSSAGRLAWARVCTSECASAHACVYFNIFKSFPIFFKGYRQISCRDRSLLLLIPRSKVTQLAGTLSGGELTHTGSYTANQEVSLFKDCFTSSAGTVQVTLVAQRCCQFHVFLSVCASAKEALRFIFSTVDNFRPNSREEFHLRKWETSWGHIQFIGSTGEQFVDTHYKWYEWTCC